MSENKGSFSVPVALFLFRRKDTVLRIIDRLREVRPEKIYLLSDEGRNEAERAAVADVRACVLSAIDWQCEVIRYFADENRGVYKNIAGGAAWVFSHERRAIFLEDDNLPEASFFPYCETLLDAYENDPRVLWVCGTNYLSAYSNASGDSCFFTQHLLPCGWASWSDKFTRCYDGELEGLSDPQKRKQYRRSYRSGALRYQQLAGIKMEASRKARGLPFASWDFQMTYSLRSQNLYGVAPCRNQICNIGADSFSTHGGTGMELEMTRRFCGVPTAALEFPLRLPARTEPDAGFERAIGKVILWPFSQRLRFRISQVCKRLLHIPDEESVTGVVKRRLKWVR